MNSSTKGVARTIQFWQFTNADGHALQGRFPTAEVLKKINSLKGGNLYAEVGDDVRLLAVEQKRKKLERRHLVLYRVRHDNVPSLETAGVITDLPIGARQNIVEETHLVFLPNNVIGVITSRDGPRVGRLASYLQKQFSIEVGICPVLDPDTTRTLSEMGRVTSVELSIPAAVASFLAPSDSGDRDVIDAFKFLAEASDSKTLHLSVVLSLGPNQSASTKWRAFISYIVNSGQLPLFNKFKIHAKSIDSQSPSIVKDFVEEKLAMKRDITLDANDSRRLNSESAYQAIVRTHRQMATTLNLAVAVQRNDLSVDDLLKAPHVM